MDPRQQPRAGFVVRIDPSDETICVLWRPPNVDQNACRTLRDALINHYGDLLERLDTLRGLLAGREPERAERLLTDVGGVRITEVIVQPLLDSERFDDLMRRALRPAADDCDP